MQSRTWISLFVIFISCSSRVTTVQSPPKPDWLKQKPVDGRYFIGIGHGLKDGKGNHISAAKSSALEDLISEIRVKVSASTALSILDIGKDFSEKYEQIIRTSAADDIEGFELLDSWEDESNYWVLYRLSKSTYQEIKAKRKKAASDLGYDFYIKAISAESEGKVSTAFSFYFQALLAIEKYLDEPIPVLVEGRELLLNNEIISGTQRLLNRIELLHSPSVAEIPRRPSTNPTSIFIEARDRVTSKLIGDLHLINSFKKGSGEIQQKLNTSPTEKAKLVITRITSPESELIINAQLDLNRQAGGNPSEITKLVLSRLATPESSVRLSVRKPLIYLASEERFEGNPKTGQRISNFIRNYLNLQGFGFTDNIQEAELIIENKSTTERGGVSGSIYIVYLDAIISVKENKEGKGREIFNTTLDRIKGYSLDYDRSSLDAYSKAIDLLEKEKLPALLSIILQ